MVTIAHRTLSINNVRYHLAEAGTGATLLCLHGFTGSHVNWRSLMTALAADYHVVAVDLLGHGQTDAPDDPARYAMERAAADLAALMAALDIDRFHLLGYSMGGRLALFTALAYPELVSTLTLESASPGLANESERAERVAADEALAASIERKGVPAFVARWEAIPLFASQARLTQQTRAELRAQRLTNRARGLANSLRGMGTGVQPSLWGRLGDIEPPTLLLAGADDAKFCAIAHAMAAQMPSARLEIVDDAGHTIHLEQSQPFQTLVKTFLDSATERRGSEPGRPHGAE